MNSGYFAVLGLGLIMALVFLLPFSVKKIEEELEAFLLLMGFCALAVSGGWNRQLALHAVSAPLPLTGAVLAAGFCFKALRGQVDMCVKKLAALAGTRLTVFLLVLALGFGSGALTAIIAALLLCELLAALRLERASAVHVAIIGCFAIGMGAALTPLGEPLAVLAASHLEGGFWSLWNLLSPWLGPGIFALALAAAALSTPDTSTAHAPRQQGRESDASIIKRAAKVYIFVAALILLGEGIKPLAALLLPSLDPLSVYWLNISSAALDNATLAAAELGSPLPATTTSVLLLGLVTAGGMLIPGNIPNIICAGKLNIRSREWAKFGFPLGLAIMLVYFIILRIFL